MSEPSSVTARMQRRAVSATLTAGLIAGILDITAAFLCMASTAPSQYESCKASPAGPRSQCIQRGSKTAVLGLALHFVIALGAAAVFYAASRKLKFLTRHAVISGFLFGVAVYVFMQYIVLPLSAFHKGPFSMSLMLIGIVIHMFCVGLPIALTIRRFPI